jgi:CRP-like cAMP-binding protein
VPQNPWIRKLENFAPLSDEDKRYLAEIGSQPKRVEADTDIISEGDRPDNVHLIVEGYACRYKILPDGRRQIMAYLIPGDICDLHVFILHEMDHSIGTLAPTRVVYIPRDKILNILESRPNLTRALWWATLQDEAIVREWLVNTGRRDAYRRVSHILCETYYRLRVVDMADNHAFDLPMTQNELADSVGLTPVHVNRMLQRLREEGLIALKGKALTILDPQGLLDAAEFQPNYLHLGEKSEGKAGPDAGNMSEHGR